MRIDQLGQVAMNRLYILSILASDKLQRYSWRDGAENMEVDVSKSIRVNPARRCNGRKIPF